MSFWRKRKPEPRPVVLYDQDAELDMEGVPTSVKRVVGRRVVEAQIPEETRRRIAENRAWNED